MRTLSWCAPLALALSVCACSSDSPGFGRADAGSFADAAPFDVREGGGGPDPTDVPMVPITDAPVESDEVLVYAHTASELFTIDPRTYAVSRVGTFRFASDGYDHRMTDIAVDSSGVVWGITFEALYRVSPTTAQCTFVSAFSGSMVNGLTFVPREESGIDEEVLLAAERTGNVYRVDTATGRTTRLGYYGGDLGSSGDLVSVRGAGTFATVVRSSDEYLAQVDPSTGRASLIGPTGLSKTWGLGYWRGRLYGFTENGDVATIDIATGRGHVVGSSVREWWGAGVTTLAPTAPP